MASPTTSGGVGCGASTTSRRAVPSRACEQEVSAVAEACGGDLGKGRGEGGGEGGGGTKGEGEGEGEGEGR